MIRRGLAVISALLCFVLYSVAATGVASAQYNPTACGFIVTPSSVVAGETVTITGQGFPPGQSVIFTVDGIVIATTTASSDPTGTVDTTATIPADLPDGTYTISVDCAGVSSTQTINVAASSSGAGATGAGAGATSGTGTLAGTGANPTPFIKAAMLLLAGGGLILLATRRRDHART